MIYQRRLQVLGLFFTGVFTIAQLPGAFACGGVPHSQQVSAPKTHLKAKSGVVLRGVKLENATVEQAVEYIVERSRKADPNGTGVKVVTVLPPEEKAEIQKKAAPLLKKAQADHERLTRSGIDGSDQRMREVHHKISVLQAASSAPKPVTLEMQKATVEEALKAVLLGQGIQMESTESAVYLTWQSS